MKRSLIAISLTAVIALAAAEVFSHGWGRDSGWGHGYGHMGYSQRGHGPGYGMGIMHPEVLKDELKLTDTQVEKINKLADKFRDKMFENRGNPDKMISLRSEHWKAVEKVLTKEQKEKVRTNRASRGYGRFGYCNN